AAVDGPTLQTFSSGGWRNARLDSPRARCSSFLDTERAVTPAPRGCGWLTGIAELLPIPEGRVHIAEPSSESRIGGRHRVACLGRDGSSPPLSIREKRDIRAARDAERAIQYGHDHRRNLRRGYPRAKTRVSSTKHFGVHSTRPQTEGRYPELPPLPS